KVMGQEQKDCYKIECKENYSFKDILKLKNIPYLLTIYFLVFLGFNFFYIAFPVHAVIVLNWTLSDIGIFFAYVGLMMVLVQGPILKRVSQKYSDAILATVGSFILAISFLFYTSNILWIFYIGGTLLSLGNGLMWSSILSILSKASEEKYQGTIQGFAGSAGSLASIIGLIIGGILYEQLGNEIFILSTVVLFISCIMVMGLLKFKMLSAQ
ncbi:MAG: MFS transporter, partial [Ignavibacteriaceae bacterium]